MGRVNENIPKIAGIRLVYNCGHNADGPQNPNAKPVLVDGDCTLCVMQHRIALYVDHARRHELPLFPIPADATLSQLNQWRNAYHTRHQIWCMVQELKSQMDKGKLPPEHHNVGEEVNLMQSELQEFSGADAWEVWTVKLLKQQEVWFHALFEALKTHEPPDWHLVKTENGAVAIMAIRKKQPRPL